jgi:hypothetical protein
LEIRDDSYPIAAVQRATNSESRRIRDEFETYGEVDEFLPRSADLDHLAPVGDGPSLIFSSEETRIESLSGSNHHRRVVEVTHAQPCRVTLQQFYFPGWSVECNGNTVPDEQLRADIDDHGRIRLRLAGAGTTVISARYEGPPGVQVCYLLALLLPALSLVAGGYMDRKKSRSSRLSGLSGPVHGKPLFGLEARPR